MLYGPNELGGTLWMNSPFVLPLVIILFSRKAQIRHCYFALLMGLIVFGLAGLAVFVASPHDDYRFLILLLLPIYQFGILAAVAGAAGLISIVRRYRRS